MQPPASVVCRSTSDFAFSRPSTSRRERQYDRRASALTITHRIDCWQEILVSSIIGSRECSLVEAELLDVIIGFPRCGGEAMLADLSVDAAAQGRPAD